MAIKKYVALMRQWAWLIALGVVVAAASAYVVSRNTTPVYRATARLLIDQAPGNNRDDYSQVLMSQRLAKTYVELIQTRPVLAAVVAELSLPATVEELAGRLAVSAPVDTQILVVSVEDTDPHRAALTVNHIGEVFIAQNQAMQSARYAETIANRQAALDDLAGTIEGLQTQLAELDEPATAAEEVAAATLEARLNEAEQSYNRFFNDLETLRVEQARESSNVVVAEQAVAPAAPVRPRTLINTVLAALVGGMVALGAVFLIEYLDDTVKSPDQVQADTGLSTLAAIAVIDGETPAERLVTFHTPRSPIAEAYRVLRTNLGFAAIDEGLRTVLITSSSPGEGKSTTSANLAVTMAQAGKTVIVVDADLRQPLQHKIFELPNHDGLTNALFESKVALSSHLQNTRVRGLRLLSSGPVPPNPAELLNSQRMLQVLEALQQEADLVIFDTPPALMVADASILASRVDGCVLVAEAGETRRGALAQAAETLRNSGATLLGVVMNRLRLGQMGYYGYYYGRPYAYYSDEEKGPKRRRRRRPEWLMGKE